MFCIIDQDPSTEAWLEEDPELPDETSLMSGVLTTCPEPVIFPAPFSAKVPPTHYLDSIAPVVSKRFCEVLRAAGVDTLQTFAAILRNPRTRQAWDDRVILNVVGLVACANLERSKFQILARRPNGGVPLVDFDSGKLVIDPAKVGTAELFRLAESPRHIIASQRVVDLLRAEFPEDELGMIARPVPIG